MLFTSLLYGSWKLTKFPALSEVGTVHITSDNNRASLHVDDFLDGLLLPSLLSRFGLC